MKGDRGRRSERGIVFLVLLVSAVIVVGAVGALLNIEHARSAYARTQEELDRAFAIAESGVDSVAALLSAKAWDAGSVLAWGDDGIDNDGDGLLDEGDESLAVTSEMWESDGIDNDGDAQVDENDEEIVRVSSSATIGRSTSRVTAWFQRTAAILPIPPAAVYLNDPAATTHFPGDSDLIDGNDTAVGGGGGSGPAVWGMAINGDPDQVISQLSSAARDNVLGAGGAPSVGAYAPNDPNFIQSFVDLFGAQASVVFNNYNQAYTGMLGDWNAQDFVITKSNGDLSLDGGGGAGILLVDGNLVIGGDWEYVGYVFVTGSVRMKGGGARKIVKGALYVGGDLDKPATDLYMKAAEVYYSSEALAMVSQAFAGYALVAMTEP